VLQDTDLSVITARDACRSTLIEFLRTGGQWCQELPEDPEIAARVWTEISEQPEKVSGNYVEQVTARLGLFLLLPHERQRVVLQAGRRGIPWRGESDDVLTKGARRWHFELVLEQYGAMERLGKERYRETVAKAVRRYMGSRQ
jgi:hypothetical protein